MLPTPPATRNNTKRMPTDNFNYITWLKCLSSAAHEGGLEGLLRREVLGRRRERYRRRRQTGLVLTQMRANATQATLVQFFPTRAFMPASAITSGGNAEDLSRHAVDKGTLPGPKLRTAPHPSPRGFKQRNKSTYPNP